MSTISPSNFSSRRRSAARSPATPAPTMTIRSPSAIEVPSHHDRLHRAAAGGHLRLFQGVLVQQPLVEAQAAVLAEVEHVRRLHGADAVELAAVVVDADPGPATGQTEGHVRPPALPRGRSAPGCGPA